MHRRTFLTAAVALPAVALAAPVRKPKADLSLVLIENVAEKDEVTKQRLLRIRVTDGVVAKPETVITTDPRFFSSYAKNRLHADRYVLSANGGVIDLTTGKIVHDEQDGDLIGVEGDQMIYKMDRNSRENGVFAFDLTKKKLSKLGPPGRWALPGYISPDGMRSAATGNNDEITLHAIGEKPRSLGKGFVVRYAEVASSTGHPPVLWLDADRLLTQTGNGELVTVSVADGKRTAVVSFAADREISSPPELWRDALGDVVYECGKGAFRIDVKAGKAEVCDWYRHPHGFDASHAADPDKGYTFRHNGAEIGIGFGAVWRPETADGHLAYVGWPKPKSGGHYGGSDEEVRVWSAVTGKWTALRMWPESLVGWVKN